jgi:hypothetical protein
VIQAGAGHAGGDHIVIADSADLLRPTLLHQ